jgi:hypothetical protein
MWDKTSLHELIRQKMRGFQRIVVADREPYIHWFARSAIECIRPASGLATALDPILFAWTAPGCRTVAHTEGLARGMIIARTGGPNTVPSVLPRSSDC